MNKHFGFTLAVVILSVFLMASTSFSENAAVRQGRTEVFVFGQTMGSDSVSEGGITLEIQDTVVGGFGMGYNFTHNFNLNADVYFGSTDFEVKGWWGTSFDADIIGMDVNLDYYVMAGNFTPLLTGGIGYINFDAGGDVEETDFSYNIGAGFRYDLNNIFIKGIYRFTWTELEDTNDAILLDGVSLFIGYIF